MCSHEDRECTGKGCPCECMNCMFPDTMSPGEALELINAYFPEELRGEQIDLAFDTLYDLCERDLNERESL